MEAEFVEADRALRFKLLAFCTVLLLLLLLSHLTLPNGTLRATDPTQALQKYVDRLLIYAVTATPLLIGLSIYLMRLAINVQRSGQYPPPGMRVTVRTQIRHGRRAKWNAILMFGLAGIMLGVVPALFYTWHLASGVASMVSELSRPNKQMQPTPRNGAADLQR
jgi:hypothetical protein